MEKENQIKSLLDDYRDKEQALCTKLDWFRLRCLLETEACIDGDGYAKYDNADSFMNQFIADCLNDKNEDVVDSLLEKYKTKEFEEDFYKFLSTVEINEDSIGKLWQNNAKIFIEKLSDYRKIGTIDGNLSEQLMDYAKKINNDPLRYIYELIQNADDCEYNRKDDKGNKTSVEVNIEIKEESLIITYPEDGMTYSDIIAITTIGQSNKRKKKKKRIIGEKGRGFKTIFSVCDYAEIHSGNFHFKLSQNSFAPEWIDNKEKEQGTKMILHFKNNFGEKNANENKFNAGADLFGKIKERYGFNDNTKDNILKNCPITFTNNIEKLVIKYGNETLNMQIEKDISSNQDSNSKTGTVKITYEIQTDGKPSEPILLECYWYEKDVTFSYKEYISHYKEIFENEDEFKNTDKEEKTYPIVLLAPKGEENIKEWKGNMFTYLPTFTNINAPISINAPFELNEDRSCMWVNGLKGDEHIEDDFEDNYNTRNELYTTKWNRRLFLELFVDQENNPSLVKYAFEQLVNEMKEKEDDIYAYLPAYKNNNHQFFSSQDAKYDECIKKINSLCDENNKNIIFENFKSLKFLKCLYNDELFCCNDIPQFFDDGIDVIILSERDGEEGVWITNGIKDSQNNENNDDENNSQKAIPIIKSLNYENILALGVKKIKLDDIEKFTNLLLEKRYDATIKELIKEQHSDYLLKENERKKMKAIKIPGEDGTAKLLSPEDTEFWLLISNIVEDDKITNNYYLKVIKDSTGVKLDSGEGKDISISEIYGKCFTNMVMSDDWGDVWRYMYSQNGNIESIKCSFGLYKELMCFYGNTGDWYQYSNECLNKKDENGSSENKAFYIPANHLKTIWKLKYQDYRE